MAVFCCGICCQHVQQHGYRHLRVTEGRHLEKLLATEHENNKDEVNKEAEGGYKVSIPPWCGRAMAFVFRQPGSSSRLCAKEFGTVSPS